MRDRTSTNVKSLFLRPTKFETGVRIERPNPTPRLYSGVMWPSLYRGWYPGGQIENKDPYTTRPGIVENVR